jgi:TetR/AcrR family transcriptional regulator, transcriptional repressor for nem operon
MQKLHIGKKSLSLQTNRSVYFMPDTKQNIIQKAFALFMTLSYKEVTMSRLLKETGLSKGGFYHHFESKEALYEQVVDQFFFGVASDPGFQPSPENSFIENMDLFLGQKDEAFKMFANHLGVEYHEINFFMFLMQAIQHLPGVRQKASIFLLKEKQQIENIIEIAQLRNEINPGIEKSRLADHLVSMFDGVEMHGVLLSQSFQTVIREKEMVREIFEWVRVGV